MKFYPKFKISLLAILVALLGYSVQASAGGTLRIDEVAVGELDPGKASDYADSILMFNVFTEHPGLLEITIVLSLLVGIAIWQKLRQAALVMGGIYIVYIV